MKTEKLEAVLEVKTDYILQFLWKVPYVVRPARRAADVHVFLRVSRILCMFHLRESASLNQA